MYKPCELTPEQKHAADVARIGLITAAPFYAHYMFAELQEMPTKDIPTAATDGRRLFYNPEYLASLKPQEAVFVFAHETRHAVNRHPQRFASYMRDGAIRGKPVDLHQFNQAADYVINADLLAEGVGTINPSWLYEPRVTGEMLVEDVYVQRYQEPPGGDGPGASPPPKGRTFRQTGRSSRNAKGDSQADANGGGFDQVLPPEVDPVTGKEDIPDEAEFREAIARAASATKAMGKMPGSLQRVVDEILQPQIDWREHVRMLITGRIGHRRESWDRPNRRRLALNPLVLMPGRAGHGAGTVACVVDNSGSIGEAELSAFLTEVGGVLADVRPKQVILIWCDAAVRQVNKAASLDELLDIRVQGSPGGGGTDFRPPFAYLAEEQITPDALIYITDLYGPFPERAPAYPVIWCASTGRPVPWGDVVRVKV